MSSETLGHEIAYISGSKKETRRPKGLPRRGSFVSGVVIDLHTSRTHENTRSSNKYLIEVSLQ